MKITHFSLAVLAVITLASSSIHAEGNCPSGYYPYNYTRDSQGNINGNQCAPIPGYSSQQQPAAPQVLWASRWGAIAVNSSTGSLGAEVGHKDRSTARAAAITRCGNGCDIVLTYHDQCAALASGARFFASASGATVIEASSLAMQSCAKKANDCEIVYSECSLPERIQ